MLVLKVLIAIQFTDRKRKTGNVQGMSEGGPLKKRKM
jgi:hypothetical protein